MKERIVRDLGLKQFDSNPIDDKDLKDLICETWLRKALYYAISKSKDFTLCRTWVLVDGVRYNITIEQEVEE